MFELKGGNGGVFEFKVNGKRYAVPTLDSMPLEDALRLTDATERGGVDSMKELVAVFDKHAEGLSSLININQFKELVAAWRDASSVAAGE